MESRSKKNNFSQNKRNIFPKKKFSSGESEGLINNSLIKPARSLFSINIRFKFRDGPMGRLIYYIVIINISFIREFYEQ
jgi:hypothetical protein